MMVMEMDARWWLSNCGAEKMEENSILQKKTLQAKFEQETKQILPLSPQLRILTDISSHWRWP